MNFLAPAFFAGLAAIAIPILIHLINRERKAVVAFPSLMFLQKIPYKSVRRQKIRHLLLLIMRCLAIALIALAFARPFLDRSKNPGAGLTGAREVVIAIDRSYSMGHGDRWTRALDAAREEVRSLGARDRATIVFFANEPTAATEPTSEKPRLEQALQRAELSGEGTQFAPAVKLAAQILGASQLPRRELLMISDYQQVGWARREEVGLPRGATMRAVDVSKGVPSDASVASVTTNRDKEGARDQVTVSARLTNVGAEVRPVDAVLELGGRVVETKRLDLPAKGAAQVRFAAVPVPNSATRGVVRISGDSLAANDRFHFTIAPDEAVSVLIVEPSSPRGNQSLFLRGAFKIGEKPAFDAEVRRIDAVTGADLEGRSLIVLNEVAPPTGSLGARIRDLVRAGGGLVIAPGEVPVERWGGEWADLLPATTGAVVDRSPSAGATVASIDYTNPIFEVFSAPRSGDFSSARVFRYRSLKARGDTGVIARFDDGSPAVVQRAYGNGKVVIWASTFDTHWTDLPQQGGVFLPFVHQLGRHVGRYSDARSWFIAGDALDLSRHAELTDGLVDERRPAGDSGVVVLADPAGARERLSLTGTPHTATLRKPGFYELRGAETPVGSGRPIAVNVDPAESDLSHLEPQELVTAALATGMKGENAAGITAEPEEQERRQTLWWYLLLIGLVLLAIETIWSNRLSRRTGGDIVAGPMRPMQPRRA